MPILPSGYCWGRFWHRDVQDLYAGYADFVNAAAFSLFGVRIVSMRYPLVVLTVIQAALMFLILRRQGLTTAPLVAALGLHVAQFRSVSQPNRQLVRLVLRRPDHCVAIVESVGLALAVCHDRDFAGPSTFLFRQLSGVFLGSGVLVFLLLEKPGSTGRDRPVLAWAMLALIALRPHGIRLARHRPAWLGSVRCVATCSVASSVPGGQALPTGTYSHTLRNLGLGAVISALPLLAYLLAHGALGAWIQDTVGAAPDASPVGIHEGTRDT